MTRDDGRWTARSADPAVGRGSGHLLLLGLVLVILGVVGAMDGVAWLFRGDDSGGGSFGLSLFVMRFAFSDEWSLVLGVLGVGTLVAAVALYRGTYWPGALAMLGWAGASIWLSIVSTGDRGFTALILVVLALALAELERQQRSARPTAA